MGDEVEFLPADKHKSFLQDGSITLGVISQTGPKYQKQSVYNIFAISQGKHEGWSWFFACWQMLKVFSNWYYHFRCVWPGMSKLPKITSLLFLYNMLRKKWVMQLIFYMKTWRAWWWEWSSILKVLKVTSLQYLYNISKKKLWMEFSIFDVSYQFLMKVARHVKSTKKGSLLNVSNILKNVLQLLLCSTVMQNTQILY